MITPASLPPLSAGIVETAVRQQWTLDELESRYIREILRETQIELLAAPRRSSASIARRCWRSGGSMGSSRAWADAVAENESHVSRPLPSDRRT